ncbi:MAG: protein kinase [Rhodobacterales bacterium]|nr:protein kinase [Rhodobacterales bacterium]
MALMHTQLEIGSVIDGVYEIQQRIGVGGMASVFKALQKETGECVAIKLIDLGHEDLSALRKRFFNELLLATRVQHPNIVAIQDFGLVPESGNPYIVMELLRGRNLHQHIRKFGPMLIEEAVPLFLGALEALSAAHAQGVVHKDLKPSNLFLCEANFDTSLVVVDFGIAVRVSDLGGDGSFVGTPRYAAPEYLIDHIVAPTLDVYQMALVFCEAISGTAVVDSKKAKECFRSHMKGNLKIPTHLMDNALERVLRKALAFDPSDRYQNAGEFLIDLAEAHGDDITLRQEVPSQGLRRNFANGELLPRIPAGSDALPNAIEASMDDKRDENPSQVTDVVPDVLAKVPKEPSTPSNKWYRLGGPTSIAVFIAFTVSCLGGASLLIWLLRAG